MVPLPVVVGTVVVIRGPELTSVSMVVICMAVLSFDVVVVVVVVLLVMAVASDIALVTVGAMIPDGVLVLFRAMRAVAVGIKCRMGGGVKVPYGPGVARGCFWT